MEYKNYLFRFGALERQRGLFGRSAVRLAWTAAAPTVVVLFLGGRMARVHFAGQSTDASARFTRATTRPPRPTAALPANHNQSK